MRLSILSTLLTAVSVVSLVSAEPIRVIENPSNANIRLGHALANANVNGNDDNVARVLRPTVLMSPVPQGKNEGISRHFCGASLREKALRLTNAFRHALGMPLIEADIAVPRVHILPVGYPNHNVMLHSQEEQGQDDEHKHRGHKHHNGDDEDREHHPHHGHHGHHGHHRHHGHPGERPKSFLRRIHRAIKSLGPWEGRAVAFVLGCGIGVLLRMFWVLSVLTFRTIRGERGEEALDREYIVYEQVPEALFVAPPAYIDEKVRVDGDMETEEHK